MSRSSGLLVVSLEVESENWTAADGIGAQKHRGPWPVPEP